MSVLDRVRDKFKTPTEGTSKTSKSPSAGSAGASAAHLKSSAPPSAGFAGASPRDSERLRASLQHRRAKVERQLRAHPELRIWTDADNVPLRPEPGEPVSLVIAVRTRMGIVSGELLIPRDRFDAGLVIDTLTRTDKPS
jgi:hypothetical protein